MKRYRKLYSKTVTVLFCICSFIFVIYLISKFTNSNSAEVDYDSDYAGNFAGSGGDLIAIKKLNELVKENFLDWGYYEATSFERRSWHRWYANYNKKHQALSLSGDPLSGWSYSFYATPQELKMISDRKIPANKLHLFLKPFPPKLLADIPTRSREVFSFF